MEERDTHDQADRLLQVAERGNERFEITTYGIGVMVWRYVDGWNTHDYYQDNVAMGQRCAEAQWGLHPSSWRVV